MAHSGESRRVLDRKQYGEEPLQPIHQLSVGAADRRDAVEHDNEDAEQDDDNQADIECASGWRFDAKNDFVETRAPASRWAAKLYRAECIMLSMAGWHW
jgi:hypothetical protein